jgi:cytochrome c peroxidase
MSRPAKKNRPPILGGHDSISGIGLRAALAGIAVAAVCCGKSEPKATPAATPDASSAPDGATAFYADRFARRPSVAAMTEIGRRLFFDPELSASRKMACATCHDPRFAYGPPNEQSTQLGGPEMKSPGMRAVPSLRYLHTLPRFSEHYFDEAVDESVDQGPTGGHGWDGRVDTAHEQARLPLTSPFEMANGSVEEVAARVAQSPYAGQVREAFGDDVFADPGRAAAAILLALEVFQQSPRDFYPYSSRYDAWLRRRVELTAPEQHGLSLFNDPKKGNCASCHPSQIRQGSFPQFTDFGFAALGVPRNRGIAANRDGAFYDLGLCGPLRTDLSTHEAYCGEFRAPTLRNAALRRVFFHNGVFHSLEEVLDFYARRDTNPGKWYPRTGGRVDSFDDLPAQYRANVNREPPFGGKRGAPPALTSDEIHDVIAFLNTLTDDDAVGR